ncbi:MAG: general secretion pathway protein GspB [Candidatus Omnitrophota bacterium]|nr:general secretion pathway protein GspB [Candidatus Omnitrophota bacterium]
MSIINDALKKADKSVFTAKAAIKNRPAEKYHFYILISVLGIVSVSVLLYVLLRARPVPASGAAGMPLAAQPPSPSLPPPVAVQPELVPPVQPEIKQPPSLTLNGIFFSEDKGSWALIDNTIVRAGDTVKGAALVNITENEVVLSYEGQEIKLKN